MSSHFIMEDEINESSNEDDNEPLPTKTKETISDSVANNTSENRNPKNKREFLKTEIIKFKRGFYD